MENSNVLEKKRFSWEPSDRKQLDYERNFEDSQQPESKEQGAENDDQSEEKEEVDIRETLRKRDHKWKVRLKNAREAAFTEGFEKGKEEGIEQARTEIDERLQSLTHILQKVEQRWNSRQELLIPGLLDLVFDLTESVVERAVENDQIREHLNHELMHLLQQLDKTAAPEVNVSAKDFEYVERLVEQTELPPSLVVEESEELKAGEFVFETDEKVVVRKFKQLINEFKQDLSVPSWK